MKKKNKEENIKENSYRWLKQHFKKSRGEWVMTERAGEYWTFQSCSTDEYCFHIKLARFASRYFSITTREGAKTFLLDNKVDDSEKG